jgi:multiple sugar transport system permease protein
MKKDFSEQQFAWVIITPAVLIVFGIVLYPLIQTLLYSLQDIDLSQGKKGSFIGLGNYLQVLSDPLFWGSLLL